VEVYIIQLSGYNGLKLPLYISHKTIMPTS